MSLRLILTRHAKSSWDSPVADDHARPLNDRGRKSAKAIGQWLSGKGYEPALVLSSDAARTRETWALMAPALEGAPKVVWLQELYHAGAETMLDVLRTAGNAPTVLMLGHNPGIAGFANMAVRHPPRHDRFRDYPTAATTVIDFDESDWRQIDWGTGTVADFTVPRDL